MIERLFYHENTYYSGAKIGNVTIQTFTFFGFLSYASSGNDSRLPQVSFKRGIQTPINELNFKKQDINQDTKETVVYVYEVDSSEKIVNP